MDYEYKNRLNYLALIGFFIISFNVLGADLCGGHDDILQYIDRPSYEDSVCVAPYKAVLMETGYQNLKLVDGDTIQQNFPQALLRIGMADKLEFNIGIPTYIHQTQFPRNGFSATTLGLKKLIKTREKWAISMESIITLPSGTTVFGSPKTGGVVNGLFGYALSSDWNLSGMLGVSSYSRPNFDRAERYWSVNPDLVVAWTKNNISLYAEVYGQSKTSATEGSGFNTDGGILYRYKKNIVIDLEAGHRISGVLGGFNYYFGTGITVQFS